MKCLAPLHTTSHSVVPCSLVSRPGALLCSHRQHTGPCQHRSSTQQTTPLSRGKQLVARSSVDPDELHENKLGPNVAAGIKDVKNSLTWRTATVIRNECVVWDRGGQHAPRVSTKGS